MKFLKQWTLAWILCASCLQSFHSVAQNKAVERQSAENLDELISNTPYFRQEVHWAGTEPPGDEETRSLRDTLEQMWVMEPVRWEPWVEGWALTRPDSPWTPSIAANLAQHYRQVGRYTKALELWEYAWRLIPGYKGGDTNRIRSQILAHWTQLLSRLGRVERLIELHELIGDDPLDAGPFKVQFDRSGEATHVMVNRPGRAYRCGTLALYNVAKQLGNSEEEIKDLVPLPSPETGFPLSRLKELAISLDIDVELAQRERKTQSSCLVLCIGRATTTLR